MKAISGSHDLLTNIVPAWIPAGCTRCSNGSGVTVGETKAMRFGELSWRSHDQRNLQQPILAALSRPVAIVANVEATDVGAAWAAGHAPHLAELRRCCIGRRLAQHTWQAGAR
jgi:hypothetical protein